jgi:hypothetical protein
MGMGTGQATRRNGLAAGRALRAHQRVLKKLLEDLAERARRKVKLAVQHLQKAKRAETATKEHVESAFREDAIKRIREAVRSRAMIAEDEIVSPELREVKPDLVLRAEGQSPVAVFLAQSAQRVNDAIFLQMAAKDPLAVIALLEADSSITSKLHQRAANRLSAVPVFRNDEWQAVQRIVREAIGTEGMILHCAGKPKEHDK